ncbi:MAG: bifunctional UDP-N-acetylmuramoyl-tripeptide:D-alanyl-D-alanine ligase/alanine racemase [Bacteroidales bacterium]|nr:bifunctional UDP-N-acetylmuramoyl-tripeptide:D-alanyl-D-alanine ligase/alanine racemase [Bacteroidales bacterium]
MQQQGYPLEAVAAMAGGSLIGNPGNTMIVELLTDSRKLSSPDQTLFFAIVTSRDNGHKYIGELYKKGIRAFCISELPDRTLPDTVYIQVNNTLEALQKLAAAHRSAFIYPVIGITGSNGKTIVKEWLHQLLSPEKTIVRSPKSFNSQIGVPLSVWQMKGLHNLGLFEAGISQSGEMDNLEKIIRPTIGVFTNIGHAHDQYFSSKEEKTLEKLKLFRHSELLIYCSDHQQIYECIEESGYSKSKLFSWGYRNNADLRITLKTVEKNGTIIHGIFHNKELSIEIPFTDEASVENAIHCWAVMLSFGYGPVVTASRMHRLTRVAMRLEMKEGINGCSVINDAYSSDPDSLAIALDFLMQQNQHNKRSVILSDMLQSSADEAALYHNIAALLSDKGVNRLIGIGPVISRNSRFFNMECSFYESTRAFITSFRSASFRNESILVKGARIFEFEKINDLLQQKSHETVLEVNLNALVHNLNYYRSLLKPGTKLMAMVKAFSYGSGSFEIANTLQFHRADYLAVAYADEGVELRKAGISLPVMVMNPEESGMEAMLQYNLEPEIYSFRTLQMLEKAVKSYKSDNDRLIPIHLKVDTGMHRLGFEPADIESLCVRIKATPGLTVQSVFSHLVGSDDPSLDEFTRHQIGMFVKMAEKLEKILGYKVLWHILNSAGISRFPEARFGMVRLGISLYGIAANEKEQKMLETVTSLKTNISQIKTIEAGETVGYNRAWQAPLTTTIATIPIGYADGLNRRLGNGKGKMLVNGHLVPVAGNICMDMTMLDITGIEATEGDEVTVFGEKLPISELAVAMDTIPYEILTGISRRVKRVYFQE